MLDLKRKMRTESRHSVTNSQQLRKLPFLGLILTFCLAPPSSTSAGPISDRLDRYVGKEADTITAAFGSPDIQLADRLRYSFGGAHAPTDFAQRQRHAPLPAANPAHAPGITTSEPPGFRQTPLPCFLDFHLDADAIVESVSYHGPGCFEVVHSRTIPNK